MQCCVTNWIHSMNVHLMFDILIHVFNILRNRSMNRDSCLNIDINEVDVVSKTKRKIPSLCTYVCICIKCLELRTRFYMFIKNVHI